jgi:hypothetical protein
MSKLYLNDWKGFLPVEEEAKPHQPERIPYG